MDSQESSTSQLQVTESSSAGDGDRGQEAVTQGGVGIIGDGHHNTGQRKYGDEDRDQMMPTDVNAYHQEQDNRDSYGSDHSGMYYRDLNPKHIHRWQLFT